MIEMWKIGDAVKYIWANDYRNGIIIGWSTEYDAWEVTVTSGMTVFLRSDEMWPANDAYGHPY